MGSSVPRVAGARNPRTEQKISAPQRLPPHPHPRALPFRRLGYLRAPFSSTAANGTTKDTKSTKVFQPRSPFVPIVSFVVKALVSDL